MAQRIPSRLLRLRDDPRARFAAGLSLAALVPAVPALLWSREARAEREERMREVSTRLRIPSVQTVDDLMVEKCQPGDVVLFDRRCDKCASGPTAAMACLLGKALLCDEDDGSRTVAGGSYEHCGIVVPGPSTAPGAEHDPSNLHLLEMTSGAGVACRPLLTRLEMSRSRSVVLLPLSCPGERRQEADDGVDRPVSEKTAFLQNQTRHELARFRDKWIADGEAQDYSSSHSALSITGCLLYATGLQPTFPVPVSPSAWLVVSALQECGAAAKLDERASREARVEDLARDGRFHERDSVRLRPGWKFLGPVVMRETSVS